MKNRIKKIRKDNKMTQVEFGEKIGVKGNTVTNYETGLRNPTDAVVLSICREFGVNEEWLRTGNGEMYQYSDSDEYSDIVARIDVNDPKARKAIIDYYHLTDSDKELWWKWVEKFLKGAED